MKSVIIDLRKTKVDHRKKRFSIAALRDTQVVVSDQITLSDAVLVITGATGFLFTDDQSVNWADAVAYILNPASPFITTAVSDTFTFLDSISVYAPINLSFSDTLSLSDLEILSKTLFFSDTLNFSDAVGFAIDRSQQVFNEWILLTDSVSLGMAMFVKIADTFSFSDSQIINGYPTAIINLTFSDQFMIGNPEIDYALTAAWTPLFRFPTDTFTFSDAISVSVGTPQVVNEVLTDSFAFGEVVTIFLATPGRNIGIFDQLTLQDSVDLASVPVLNSYIRRYLNDVIPN